MNSVKNQLRSSSTQVTSKYLKEFKFNSDTLKLRKSSVALSMNNILYCESVHRFTDTSSPKCIKTCSLITCLTWFLWGTWFFKSIWTQTEMRMISTHTGSKNYDVNDCSRKRMWPTDLMCEFTCVFCVCVCVCNRPEAYCHWRFEPLCRIWHWLNLFFFN